MYFGTNIESVPVYWGRFKPNDMNLPGWDLHPLVGNLKEHWSVKVNGNWRVTFKIENGHAEIVDYQDYH